MTGPAQAASDPVEQGLGGDGALRDWAFAAYGAPGVSDACLDLQDTQGHNVPLLLWAAWAARTGRVLDQDTLEAACDTARAWDTAAVAPLRALRRTLKGQLHDMDPAARISLREAVKALELTAETHLLAGLEALTPAAGTAPRPALDGLVEVARVWNRVVPRPALKALAERLPA